MRSLRTVVSSPYTPRIVLVIILLALISVFREELLKAFGIGMMLPVVVAGVLTWCVWEWRLPSLLRRWNMWLAAMCFAVALLGALGFVKEGGDELFSEVSLGGTWGRAIITGSAAAGVFILLAAVVTGVALLYPARSLELARTQWPRVASTMRLVREKLDDLWDGIRDRCQEKVFHKAITNRLPGRAPQPAEKSSGVPVRAGGVVRVPSPATAPPPDVKLERVAWVKSSPGRWERPSVDLLDGSAGTEENTGEFQEKAGLIEKALASYGVEAKVVQINVGPAVTQYGVEPGWKRRFRALRRRDDQGKIAAQEEEVSRTRVKLESIVSLSDDLAMALAAPSVRVEAPIPGKSLVGIEVPNESRRVVSLREVVESTAYAKLADRAKLAVAVGIASGGEMVVRDMVQMPHLLIAGATGSGKTVCLECTIASLLMNNTPEDLRFIMIDPKRVELIAFEGLPHLMAPVVTESGMAAEALEWANQEMDRRYKQLAATKSHSIERYNRNRRIPDRMPYVVVVVDELADLMMARRHEVEAHLCRLAQMGRAVGIHVVVATQRPSVDVITGLIKANFPTRISFMVVSQIDSRTILDVAGAEKLLGKGDMLLLPSDAPKPVRVQGCFISQDEIGRLVEVWRTQTAPV